VFPGCLVARAVSNRAKERAYWVSFQSAAGSALGSGNIDEASPRPRIRAPVKSRRSRAATRPEGDDVTDDGANPALLHRLRSSLNTMPRCIAHQLCPTSTGRPQNMPRRRGFGSPSIQRHPRKSASVSTPLLPPPSSSQMRRALLLGTSVAKFASRATLGSLIRACSHQLGGWDDSDIAVR
jgi:hypothetical protein